MTEQWELQRDLLLWRYMFAFQGWGGWDQDLGDIWVIKLKTLVYSPPGILFVLFYILKCEDTNLFLCILKKTQKGGETTVSFFLSKHAGYFGGDSLPSVDAITWKITSHSNHLAPGIRAGAEKTQNGIIYLLNVSSNNHLFCSRKLMLAFSVLINTDIKNLAIYETISE